MAISKGVDGMAPVSAGAVRVAVLCGLVQMLDGYDLSAVGLAAPAIIKAWGVKPVELTSAFAFSSAEGDRESRTAARHGRQV